MKFSLILLTAWAALAMSASAVVRIDEQVLGEKLGGWTKRGAKAAEYPLSGASYRTYKPEVTPTPEGGIFISLRIDHIRGWLSSDDHAILEITVNASGVIVSAKSNIAIQGRSIASDVIRGGTGAGQKMAGVDRAVQIGTDLVADLSEKMLREKIVEAGRVSLPSVLRHNYNLLFQAIRYEADPKAETVEGEPLIQKPEPPPAANANPSPSKLEVKPYGDPQVDLPVPKTD